MRRIYPLVFQAVHLNSVTSKRRDVVEVDPNINGADFDPANLCKLLPADDFHKVTNAFRYFGFRVCHAVWLEQNLTIYKV